MKAFSTVVAACCLSVLPSFATVPAQAGDNAPLPGDGSRTDFHYCNPVVKQSLPDPTVMRAEDGYFYLYATENTRNVPIYRSPDLVSWEFLGTVFTEETRPDFVENGRIWAPDINYIDGRYVLYYSMSTWGGEWACGIGVATADSPAGPFVNRGKLFLSSEIDVRNSIDQFYFEDEDGSKWLFWGSFSGIYAVELSDDGLSLKEGAVKHRVAGTFTEGTMVYRHDGYYYLVGSAGSCCVGAKSTYHLVVARSENLLGPYVDKDGLPALGNRFSELLHRNPLVVGPGHCSEIVLDDAGQTWLLYHGFMADDPDVGRVLYLDRVEWDSEGWPYIVSDMPSVVADRPAIPDRTFTYSDVDYIEYNGGLQGRYLYDTGYVPKEDTRVEARCRTYAPAAPDGNGSPAKGQWQAVFSSRLEPEGYSLFVTPDGKSWGMYTGGYVNVDCVPHEYDTDFDISLDRHSLKANACERTADASAYCPTTGRLTVFSGFKGSTYYGRIYHLKIYEGDKLVHDYRPCVRNEDGLPLLRDAVTGTILHPSDPRAFSYGMK